MPTYSYRCANCDFAFDQYQAFTDDSLTICPNCGQPQLRKVFNAIGVTFNGSGFYRTDSRAKQGGQGKADSGSSGSSSSSDSGSSGSSSSGSGDSSSKPKSDKVQASKPAGSTQRSSSTSTSGSSSKSGTTSK